MTFVLMEFGVEEIKAGGLWPALSFPSSLSLSFYFFLFSK